MKDEWVLAVIAQRKVLYQEQHRDTEENREELQRSR
jgi:hypothetical protein